VGGMEASPTLGTRAIALTLCKEVAATARCGYIHWATGNTSHVSIRVIRLPEGFPVGLVKAQGSFISNIST